MLKNTTYELDINDGSFIYNTDFLARQYSISKVF